MPLIFPYGWRRALDLRERRVEREMLDHLPPSHPDARSSRSDLYWLNVLMGNFRWLRGEIGRLLKGRREPLRVLELGAGDGSLPYTFPRHWRRHVVWTGIDRFGWPCSERLMGWTRWVQGDARRIEWPDCDVLVANLFLHHFDDATLGLFASKVPPSARRILICEPVRRARSVLLLLLLRGWLINRVTWHDGVVSIGAGFRRGELPATFVLDPSWTWRETVAFPASLRASAGREEAA